ncbi:unnamed protein product [Urochloa decumbens]|uniref:DUF4220 domain-containing protein n=1 Tax=Urochloa decumbens TaxID=240449 RepID=A0ABC9EYQ0_9POAL
MFKYTSAGRGNPKHYILCLGLTTKMRPMVNGEEVGGGNLMEKQWLELSPAKELWEAWGIHFLILLSFFLQAFLFLAAGMRRRSSSNVLSRLLWLAYVSADSVAIFVLGHLAAHASGPNHHLMFFWAPFVLVHLGGQDTITAFSKQDNELWKRHLVNLVYQAAVAGYVVAEASWPDGRLRAAMVLMFLSGFVRYAERTWCLFNASSAALKFDSQPSRILAEELRQQVIGDDEIYMLPSEAISIVRKILRDMLSGSMSWQSVPVVQESVTSIMSLDAPLNKQWTILAADHLPDMLKEFLSSENHDRAYEFLVAHLAHCYQTFYTKNPVRSRFYQVFGRLAHDILVLLCTPFQYASIPIALMLFWVAEKRDHSSRADITVSYILLLGAIVLDVSTITMSILTRVADSTASYIQPACCREQWSGALAQYSFIRRHSVRDTAGIGSSIRQWIGKTLSALGVDLFDVAQVPLSKDIKEFILHRLLHCGTRKEWTIASSRGQLALQEWVQKYDLLDRDSSMTWGALAVKSLSKKMEALHRTTSSSVAFPTSVLIWHIATDICYYCKDKASASSSSAYMNKHKEMSRELSNYVMYLVFKCGVMLTTNAQLAHDRTRDQVEQNFGWNNTRAEEAVTKLFCQTGGWTEDYPSALIPARNVARELMRINDEDCRWELIISVWSEMLYYAAPRCVSAFHYEHLATGGEFATHVLLLMAALGGR